MSILKIKNCLAVIVLLGATSGYSMESTPPLDREDGPVPPPRALGLSLESSDRCLPRHPRCASVSSDSDSDDEGAKFVRISNLMEGISVGVEDKRLDLLKMATKSRASMDRAENLVSKAQRHAAEALRCQTEAIRSFAQAANLHIVSEVSVDKGNRFFGKTACSLAREEMETASILRTAAVSEAREAVADIDLAVAQADVAFGLERKAAACPKAKKKKQRKHP
jgi:hypothetical protein